MKKAIALLAAMLLIIGAAGCKTQQDATGATEQPATAEQTAAQLTTVQPTTEQPTTAQPTTAQPATEKPTEPPTEDDKAAKSEEVRADYNLILNQFNYAEDAQMFHSYGFCDLNGDGIKELFIDYGNFNMGRMFAFYTYDFDLGQSYAIDRISAADSQLYEDYNGNVCGRHAKSGAYTLYTLDWTGDGISTDIFETASALSYPELDGVLIETCDCFDYSLLDSEELVY